MKTSESYNSNKTTLQLVDETSHTLKTVYLGKKEPA
jgi:hypothetical protein